MLIKKWITQKRTISLVDKDDKLYTIESTFLGNLSTPQYLVTTPYKNKLKSHNGIKLQYKSSTMKEVRFYTTHKEELINILKSTTSTLATSYYI